MLSFKKSHGKLLQVTPKTFSSDMRGHFDSMQKNIILRPKKKHAEICTL